MFNILIDALPDSYGEVSLKTDFRQVLKFFKIIEDEKLSENEKAHLIIMVFFDTLPSNDPKLWEFIQFYVSGGEKEQSKESTTKTFCFLQDSGLIYTAFIQVYNIDLLKCESMHWWKFLELFKNLPDTTQFSKVVEIRQKEYPKNCTAKERFAIMKAKERYKLKTKQVLNMNDFF